MRLFMRVQDSEDKYAELDHTKCGMRSDDHLICHDEELMHELWGTMLIDNLQPPTLHKPAETYLLEKSVSSLVFFTKLPHSVSIKRMNNSVQMMVTM